MESSTSSEIRDLHEKLNCPAVFRGKIDGWACRNWTLDEWATKFGQKVLSFRQPPSQILTGGPLWEGQCQYNSAMLKDFVQWQEDPEANKNLFGSTQHDCENWAYADYKHLSRIFCSKDEVLQSVDWSPFGFEGRNGEKSTLWVGSQGAHTPCHYDTYGYNLVAQLIGRKRWVLFPPEDSDSLYPTRIPYEESSVFSQVDVGNPYLDGFPKFLVSRPHIITLEPGDVLYVPHRWWHYVYSLSTTLSINTWIELEVDDDRRLEESISRMIVTALMCPCGYTNHQQHKEWINPTEEYTSPELNLGYVRQMLKVVQQKINTPHSKVEAPCEVSCVRPEKQPASSSDAKRRQSDLESLEKKKFCKEANDFEVTLISSSSFEEYLETAKDTRNKILPANQKIAAEKDGLQVQLNNAIAHPDVVQLICEKLKQQLI